MTGIPFWAVFPFVHKLQSIQRTLLLKPMKLLAPLGPFSTHTTRRRRSGFNFFHNIIRFTKKLQNPKNKTHQNFGCYIVLCPPFWFDSNSSKRRLLRPFLVTWSWYSSSPNGGGSWVSRAAIRKMLVRVFGWKSLVVRSIHVLVSFDHTTRVITSPFFNSTLFD